MEGDLQQTMSAAEEAEKAKHMMMERLKEMQSQMIVGQQLQAKAAKQEAELRRAQIAKVSTRHLSYQHTFQAKACFFRFALLMHCR